MGDGDGVNLAGIHPGQPGGFVGDYAGFLRGPETSEAVMDLLKNRDGLALGICNGFQALIKLGLVPRRER